jgi:putative tryptophan/tyrosine transport system substrate-binding protein
MDRRQFLASLIAAGIAGPGLARAQAGRTLRLGTIVPSAPMTADSPFGKVLIDALGQHGYAIGRNLTFEARGSLGDNAKLAPMLGEMTAKGVDVLVAVGYPAVLAAKATGVPTVVAWGAGDPVATGLVGSYAHPGGSVTGISDVATTLTAKRLELLKEVAPKLHRVAMLWNRDDLGMSLRYEASAKTAQSLGVDVQALGVREPDDFDGVFTSMDREPPDGILMVADALTNLNRKRVFDYAVARRLPVIYEYDCSIRDGGLMSYGPDLSESLGRAAAMVDRIAKGAKPGDLPFEQPTRYPFVLNLKAAKAIGLQPSSELLALADDVIE